MTSFLAHFYRILAGSPERGYLVSGLRTELGAVAGRRPGEDEMRVLIQDATRLGHVTVVEDALFGSDRVILTPEGIDIARRL